MEKILYGAFLYKREKEIFWDTFDLNFVIFIDRSLAWKKKIFILYQNARTRYFKVSPFLPMEEKEGPNLANEQNSL